MSRLRAEIQQKKPFSSAAEEAFLNLLRTADHLGAKESELLSAHDLTPAQYNVLRILRGAGDGGHPCQEIGARMISRVPDVTRLIDRLEAAGHVTRERSTEDRRVVFVRIKPRALDLLARLDAPMAALPKALFADLTARELDTLNDLLVRARGAP